MENLQMIGDCLFLKSPKSANVDAPNEVEDDEYMLLDDFLSPRIKRIDNEISDFNSTKNKLTEISKYITIEEVRVNITTFYCPYRLFPSFFLLIKI